MKHAYRLIGHRVVTWVATLLAALSAAAFASGCGAADDTVLALAKQERPALIETLRQLTAIESGSYERAELDRISALLADRLRALDGGVEFIEPGEADTVRLSGIPEKPGRMVKATFTGTGTRKILLIAHMDTVYPKGMGAGQPFKIEGDRIYGLAISDARGGLATILHALAILKAMNYHDYGTLTVLFNGDEEVGSPAARLQQQQLGAAHDATLSFEGGGSLQEDRVRLTTSGHALAHLSVRGRASHAGAAPERGINALDELSFQILQMRDLSDPAKGVKVNWTLSHAGVVYNMIPPAAEATADVRVTRVADFDGVEAHLRERITKKLLPDSVVELTLERRVPPLEARPASRALANHAAAIYTELGLTLKVVDDAGGGFTDAANAAFKTTAPVVEGFGLRGFGAHSANAEYVLMSSIEPRLYLATRMIMDMAAGKVPLQ